MNYHHISVQALIATFLLVVVQSLLTYPQYTINTNRGTIKFQIPIEKYNNKSKNCNPKKRLLASSQEIQESSDENVDIFQKNKNEQSKTQRWVLLVDDEEDIRNAIGQYLFSQGYQVTTCADAESALDIMYSASEKSMSVDDKNVPDLIITDIVMPGTKSGLDFLKQIRSTPQMAGIPVILLTAKGRTKDRVLGYQYGADAYLPKPFDPDELLSIIDSLLSNYDALNTPVNKVDVSFSDIQRDLQDIKQLLLQEGGAGIGNGKWIKVTKVFLIPDERKVLELLCLGLTNKEIASKLFISQRRVEQHITSMFRKTEVGNRTELVRWAVSTGNVKL